MRLIELLFEYVLLIDPTKSIFPTRSFKKAKTYAEGPLEFSKQFLPTDNNRNNNRRHKYYDVYCLQISRLSIQEKCFS